MGQDTPASQDMARFLLALEAEGGDSVDGSAGSAERTFEKLRQSLAKFIGTAGYEALLGRALSQSKAAVPWLRSVRVSSLGMLEGFSEAVTHQTRVVAESGSTTLLAYLLELLITFVGQDLTLQLVRDAYPSASLNNIYRGAEETP